MVLNQLAPKVKWWLIIRNLTLLSEKLRNATFDPITRNITRL